MSWHIKSKCTFFKSVVGSFPHLFKGKVLDIGALDINGGPHSLFVSESYVGTDILPGKNISLVSRGEDVDLPSNFFDVVMSSECFEHNPNWRSTFHNMVRMTKPGGITVFSCAGIGRPEHGTTRSDGGYAAPLAVISGQEYYKNVTKRDVKKTIDCASFVTFAFFSNHASHDLYFIGLKKTVDARDLNAFIQFQKRYSRHLRYRGNFIRGILRLCVYRLRRWVNKYPRLKSKLKSFFNILKNH